MREGKMYSQIDEDIKKRVDDFKRSQLVKNEPATITTTHASESKSNTGLIIAGAVLGLLGAFGAYSFYDDMQYKDECIDFVSNKDDIC